MSRAFTSSAVIDAKRGYRPSQIHDASTEPKFDYFKRHLDVQMQAATAWIAYREGRNDEAVDLLRQAGNAEDILGKHPVSPGPLIPVREQLGRLLLELNRPQEAQKEFEAVLKIYPGRFQALSGAAQAAERTREKKTATHYYAKLVEQTAKADGPRSEVVRARAYVSAKDSGANSDKTANDGN